MPLNYLTYNYDLVREKPTTPYIYGTLRDATTMGITLCCECIARREYSMVWSGKYWTSPHDDGCAHARYKCMYTYCIFRCVLHQNQRTSVGYFFADRRDAIFRRETTHGWSFTLAPENVFAILWETWERWGKYGVRNIARDCIPFGTINRIRILFA